jgi:hypothetical protein
MATTEAVGYVNNTPPNGLADETGQRDRGQAAADAHAYGMGD